MMPTNHTEADLNEVARITESAAMRAESEAVDRAALNALAQRRASSEICTYVLDGWMVREHPGGRIERLAPADEFRSEDFPYPGFKPPRR